MNFLIEFLKYNTNLRFLILNLYLSKVTNQGLVNLADAIYKKHSLESLSLNIGLNDLEGKSLIHLSNCLLNIFNIELNI